MPSFDVVSEVDMQEITNAVDQTNREIGTRYDFKGSDCSVELEKEALVIHGESEFHIQQIQPMLYQRLSKRGIDIACMDAADIEISGQRAHQRISIKQGVDKELAKKIIKLIKEGKTKVQAQVQGEQVRVTGKKRDELQEVIAMLRAANLELPLQYQNFRD